MNLFRSTTTTPIESNSLNRSRFRRTTLPAGAISLLLTTISFSQAATFISFDVPGAVDTLPEAANLIGTITGFYVDATNFRSHGFVRAPDGTITTFDPPGSVFTDPTAINRRGTITGSYLDASFVGHGFVRAPGGTFTTFDVPGAVFGPEPVAINRRGTIAGSYFDASFVGHGFIRIP